MTGYRLRRFQPGEEERKGFKVSGYKATISAPSGLLKDCR